MATRPRLSHRRLCEVAFGSIAADHHSRRVYERPLTNLCLRPLTEFRTKRGMRHTWPILLSLESGRMTIGTYHRALSLVSLQCGPVGGRY